MTSEPGRRDRSYIYCSNCVKKPFQATAIEKIEGDKGGPARSMKQHEKLDDRSSKKIYFERQYYLCKLGPILDCVLGEIDFKISLLKAEEEYSS